MQAKLHRTFRRKIEEWKEQGLVDRVVLTYHYQIPPTPSDSLYVCLDIPVVEELVESQIEVSQETSRQIPSEITRYFNNICQENHIKYTTRNYKAEIERNKRNSMEMGTAYYNDAPVEQIVQFASIGTKIAMEILDHLEKDQDIWSQDSELSDFIFARLGHELGSDYKWIDWALHFVCNPLRIQEGAIMLEHLGNPVLTTIKKDLTWCVKG